MNGGIEPIFLRLHPRDIALAKFLLESYEDIGIVRTLDRHAAIIVVLAVDDFVADTRGVVAELCRMIECEEIEAPPDAGDDWLLAAMRDEA